MLNELSCTTLYQLCILKKYLYQSSSKRKITFLLITIILKVSTHSFFWFFEWFPEDVRKLRGQKDLLNFKIWMFYAEKSSLNCWKTLCFSRSLVLICRDIHTYRQIDIPTQTHMKLLLLLLHTYVYMIGFLKSREYHQISVHWSLCVGQYCLLCGLYE